MEWTFEEDRKADSLWSLLLKSDRFSSCHDLLFRIELIDSFILDILKCFNKSSLIQFHNMKKDDNNNQSIQTYFAKILYNETNQDKSYYSNVLRSEYNDTLLKTLDVLPLDDILSWNHLLNGDIGTVKSHTIAFFYDTLKVPEWVNWDLIIQGQEALSHYLISYWFSVLYYSLINSCTLPTIVNLLYTYQDYSKLIMSISDILLKLIQNTESLQPGGEGWFALVRLRLIFSAFRHHKRTQRQVSEKTNNTNRPISTVGTTIGKMNTTNSLFYYKNISMNQLDMISMLIGFSYNAIIIMKCMGTPLTEIDEHSILHLFRYVGYLIGINNDNNPCISIEKCKDYYDKYVQIKMYTLSTDEQKLAPVIIKRIYRSIALHQPEIGLFQSHMSHEFQMELSRLLLSKKTTKYFNFHHNWGYTSWVFLFLILIRIWSFFIAFLVLIDIFPFFRYSCCSVMKTYVQTFLKPSLYPKSSNDLTLIK